MVEHKIAVIMTVHDLNMALRYADRFILLKDQYVHTCGEPVADEKMRAVDGQTVCIPCPLASRQ